MRLVQSPQMEHPHVTASCNDPSLPMAFEMVKAMQAEGLEWGEGFRSLGRQALAEVIEDQMAMAIDRYLKQLEAADQRARSHAPALHLQSFRGDEPRRIYHAVTKGERNARQQLTAPQYATADQAPQQ